MNKIWHCKIGEVDVQHLPDGSDLPMRIAIVTAYRQITGREPQFLFSGWGSELKETERAVVDNRLPDPDVIAAEYAASAPPR